MEMRPLESLLNTSAGDTPYKDLDPIWQATSANMDYKIPFRRIIEIKSNKI